MRKKITKLLLFTVIAIPLWLVFSTPKTAEAANPATINFQGKVVDANGLNIANGSYSFVFRLYQNVNIGTYNPNALSCSADTNCWWEETDTLTITNGIFQVPLGATCAFTSACNSGHGGIDFNSQNALSLTMKFNGDAAGYMTPLMSFQSVPYALNSDKLGGLAASAFGQLSATNSWTGANSIQVASATAFQVLNSTPKAILTVDTSANNVKLGAAGTGGVNGSLVFNTTNASSTTITISAASTGTSYSLTLPTTGPSTSQCLQSDPSTASQLIFGSCAGGGGGDNITVNGSSATDANFIDTAAAGTITGSTWTLNTAPSPDTIALSISNASSSQAGSVTTGTQTFAGDKTFQSVGSNSATAFQIQNVAGNAILNADTTIGLIKQKTFGLSYLAGEDATGSLNSGSGIDVYLQTVVVGKYLYAVQTGDPTACSQSVGSALGCELQVYDVSNPSNPKYVGGADSSGQTNSGTQSDSFRYITVSGRYAYITGSGDATACTQNTSGTGAIGCELKIFDISNPSAPTYVGGADISGLSNSGTGNLNVNGIAVSGNTAYITSNGSNTACSATPGSAIGCELQAYDVSNPASPRYLGGADATGSTNSGGGNVIFNAVSISGNYAYVAKSSDASSSSCSTAAHCELMDFNISNPAAPTYVGGADSDGNTNSGTGISNLFNIAISGHYAYVGGSNAATCGSGAGNAIGCEVKVFDITNPASPTYIGGAEADGTANGGGTNGVSIRSLQVNGNYLYVSSDGNATACSQTAGSAVGCELKIYDVSNPAVPTYMGGADISGSTNSNTGNLAAKYMTVSGRYAYVVTIGNSGTACAAGAGNAIGCEIQIYDVSGIEATSVTAHSLEAGTLTVDQSGLIYGDLSLSGALTVGQSTELSGNLSVSGYSVFKNLTNSSSAFQVQNAIGDTAIGVDTTSINALISNPSFENASTIGWSANGTGASITATNAQQYVGSYALDFTTGTAIGNEARYNIGTGLSTSTTYTLSFYVKAGTAMSTLSASYSPDGTAGNETDCAVFNPSRSVVTTGWTRYYCTIDTSSTSATGSGFIAIKQSDATNRHLYIDGVQIEAGSAITQGQVGETGFESALTNWAAITGAGGASNTAVKSSADFYNGANDLLITDATTPASGTGAKYTTANTNPRQLNTISTYTLSFWAKASGSNFSTLEAGYARDGSTQLNCTLNSTSVVTTGWTYYSCAIVTDSTSPVAGAYLYIEHTGVASTTWKVDDVQLTLNTNVTTGSSFKETGIALNGVVNSPTAFKNQADSTTAMQVQNSSGNNILTVDSLNQHVNIGSFGTATGQLYVGGLVPASSQGSVALAGSPTGIYVIGNYAYITQSSNLVIADVSQPSNPVLLTTFALGFTARVKSLVVRGHYAYMTDATNQKLVVVDVSNPFSPSIAGSASAGATSIGTLYIQGNYAFSSDNSSSKLYIFDISNPKNPRLLSSTPTAHSPNSGIVVQGKYAYQIEAQGSVGYMEIFDVSNTVSPSSVSTVGSQFTNVYSISVRGKYAYLAENYGTSSYGAIVTYDVSNPASPSLISVANTLSGPLNDIFSQGRYIYAATYSANKLEALDFSNPSAPTNLWSTSTSGTADFLYVQGRYAYVVVDNALQVFDLGGTYTQQLEAGGVEVGTLAVDSNANFAGDANVQGGLVVGQSLQVNGNIGGSGQVAFQNAANSTSAFQVQNAIGSAALSVDTTVYSSLITNAGFEGQTIDAGWAALGTAGAPARATDITMYQGSAGLKSAWGTTNGNGFKYNYTFANAVYSLSFKVRLTAGTSITTTTGLVVGFHDSVDHDCTLSPSPASFNVTTANGWGYFKCSSTTLSAGAGYFYIYENDSAGSGRTVYLDNVDLELASSAVNFRENGISLSGAISSPVLLQNAVNSTTAFQIQNSAGQNVIAVDTINSHFKVYDGASTANYVDIYYDTANSAAVFAASSGTTQVGSSSAGAIAIGNGNTTTLNMTANASSTWQAAGATTDLTISAGRNLSLSSGGTGGTLSLTSSVTTGTGTSSAIALSDTALTSGTGMQFTVSNPQINANAGLLAASASLLNISSANHNYLSLTNSNLSFGGHSNMMNIGNVKNTYVYDTSADRDGGRWTSDERALSSSWYNETIDQTANACSGVNSSSTGTDRCGQRAFPDKAILVVAGNSGVGASAYSLYIFNAADNSLWMRFDENAGSTIALGTNTNATITSVTALNGSIYLAETGTSSLGMVEINFVRDVITRYNATDASDYAGNISSRNTAQTTAYASQGRTGMAIVNANVEDVNAQIVGGKTFVAVGTDGGANGGISLINETAQSVANFSPANKEFNSVFLTADDNLYGLNSSDAELDVWYGVSSRAGNNTTAPTNCTSGPATSCKYDETSTPAIEDTHTGSPQSPSFAVNRPDSLYVTNGTSEADGQSNTVYMAEVSGLQVLSEKVGAESSGAVKKYTFNASGSSYSYTSDQLYGDARNFLPFEGSGSLANNTNIIDQSPKLNAMTAKNANGTGMAYGSGVRDTAITAMDNTDDYICTGSAGTCADDNDLDPSTTGGFTLGSWIKRSGTGDKDTIMAKWGNTGTPANDAYAFYLTAGNVLTCDQGNGSGTTTSVNSGATTLTDTANWHYVACVYDRTSGTLKIYVDGIQWGSTADANNNGGASAVAYTVGADLSGAANAAANFFRGSIDEPFVSMTSINISQVRNIYSDGLRALNNPNHTGSTTIRGVSVGQDLANGLWSYSSVYAVRPDLSKGLIYVGTNGGVSVMGMDTDTLVDLYSISINTKDDVNTNYDTTNGNQAVSVSVGKGFGTGNVLSIGLNNAGAGGAWNEIASTGLIDFLGNSYDPFGDNLTQSNMTVDRVFRVTNQDSTRLDDTALASTNQPQIYDLLRVDSNGLTLAPGSSITGTTIMKTTDISGNTNFSIRSMGTNFGSLVTGGGFEGRDSYFGDEFNIGRQTATQTCGANATATEIGFEVGDYGNHNPAAIACGTSQTTNGSGEFNFSTKLGAGTAGQQCQSVYQAGTANGVDRLVATSTATAANTANCVWTLGATNATSSKIYAAANLPVMAWKVKASTMPANASCGAATNNCRARFGMWASDTATGNGMGAPANGIFFSNCSTESTTTGSVSGCSNTNWYGHIFSASAEVAGGPVTCSVGSGDITTNFAYLRIEVRSTTDVHFFADYNTSNGIAESECGTGLTSTTASAMAPFMQSTVASNIANTVAFDVDYVHSWQDDNIPTPDQSGQSQATNGPNTAPNGDPIQTVPPISPDSPDPSIAGSFFNFNAATSQDTVFNNNVYVHGTLYADKIEANQIEGLSVFTNQLASLQAKLAADAITSAGSTSGSGSTSGNSPIQTATTVLNLNDGLSVGGDSNFRGNVFFYKLVTFTEKTFFNNDITIGAHVLTAGNTPTTQIETAAGLTTAPPDNQNANLAKATINGNDSSGQFSLTIGDNSDTGKLLTVKFDKQFDNAPHIFLSATNGTSSQMHYYIQSTNTGFTIYTTDSAMAAGTQLTFNYWVVQ